MDLDWRPAACPTNVPPEITARASVTSSSSVSLAMHWAISHYDDELGEEILMEMSKSGLFTASRTCRGHLILTRSHIKTNEIHRLISTVDDPATKKVCSLSLRYFHTRLTTISSPLEMQAFFGLISQNELNRKTCTSSLLDFLCLHTYHTCSDWDHIKSPEDHIAPYANLPKPKDSSNLNRLAVLKVSVLPWVCLFRPYTSLSVH